MQELLGFKDYMSGTDSCQLKAIELHLCYCNLYASVTRVLS